MKVFSLKSFLLYGTYLIKLLFLGVHSLARWTECSEGGRFPVGPRPDLHLVAVAEAFDELTQSTQADSKALMTALQGTRIQRSITVLY